MKPGQDQGSDTEGPARRVGCRGVAIGAACLLLLILLLLPLLPLHDRTPPKAWSINNLKQLGLFIHMYSFGSDAIPPSLTGLYPDPCNTLELFLDPLDESPPLRGPRSIRCSYEYVGPLPFDCVGGAIIAYSRRGIHKGGRVVLYGNGAVRWRTEDQLSSPAPAGEFPSLRNSYELLISDCGERLSEERKAALRRFYEIEP
ncbi:MAG: hypothetical protein AMK73_00380 [Planctomycetes bacterium SM23_32]|nr:MAG: hypothetical protein AMK73_00380 [Planctomycetes bacterium SM23_32]